MNLEAVLTKLMWILGQNPENFDQIRKAFYRRINLIFLFNDREENSDGL